MKSKTEGRLTHSALLDVIKGTSVLFDEGIKRGFAKQVADANIPVDAKHSLIGKLQDFEVNIFNGLNSEYLQEKNFKENFDYLVSCSTYVLSLYFNL